MEKLLKTKVCVYYNASCKQRTNIYFNGAEWQCLEVGACALWESVRFGLIMEQVNA